MPSGSQGQEGPQSSNRGHRICFITWHIYRAMGWVSQSLVRRSPCVGCFNTFTVKKYSSSKWSNKKCIGNEGSCRPFSMTEFPKYLTISFVVFFCKTLSKSSHISWKWAFIDGKEKKSIKECGSTFQTTMTLDVPFRLKTFLEDDLMAIPPH